MKCDHGQDLWGCKKCEEVSKTVNEGISRVLQDAGFTGDDLFHVLCGVTVGEAVHVGYNKGDVLMAVADYYDAIAENVSKGRGAP